MTAGMTIDEVREALQLPESIAARAFEIARSLGALARDGTDPQTLQELVLRALDKHTCFRAAEPLIHELVRAAGLFPYLSPDRLSARDRAACERHGPLGMDDDGVVFHRVQWEVYRALLDGNNVMLSAPTSFGKSLIVDALIATQRFRTIVLIVPTIALIDETRQRIARFRAR